MVEGASGMELTTKLGAAAGSGGAAGFAATTGLSNFSVGQSGTMRTRHSTGGTNKDFGEGAVNMKFLDSYFSQVIWWEMLWLRYLFTLEIFLPDCTSVSQFGSFAAC